MEIMGRFHTTSTLDPERDADVIVLETEEQETVVFEGSTREEVDAKVADFLTWAS